MASRRLEGRSMFLGAEGQLNAYVTLPDGVEVEMQEDQGLQEEITGYHVHWFVDNAADILRWYVDMFDLETGLAAGLLQLPMFLG